MSAEKELTPQRLDAIECAIDKLEAHVRDGISGWALVGDNDLAAIILLARVGLDAWRVAASPCRHCGER